MRRSPFTRKMNTFVEQDGKGYLVEVTLRCIPGDRGRICGDPDDCYPPEPASGEVEDVVVVKAYDDADTSLVGKHVDWEIDLWYLLDQAFEAQVDENNAMREDEWEERRWRSRA